MTYGRLGQKRTMDDPDSGDWTYVYDKVGNLTSQQDGEGDWLFFEYDGLNRLLKRRADSASGTVLAEYAYDSPYVGGLDWSKAHTASGEVRVDHLSYDDAGRVLTRTLTMPGSQVFKEAFTYNHAGNVLTRAYPDGTTGNTGEVVTYDYDTVSGLPLTLEGDATYSSDDYVTSTTWNPIGQITAQQAGDGDGLYWDPAYDVHTRLERSLVRQGTSTGAISQDYNYDRDDNGMITRIWDDTGGLYMGNEPATTVPYRRSQLWKGLAVGLALLVAGAIFLLAPSTVDSSAVRSTALIRAAGGFIAISGIGLAGQAAYLLGTRLPAGEVMQDGRIVVRSIGRSWKPIQAPVSVTRRTRFVDIQSRARRRSIPMKHVRPDDLERFLRAVLPPPCVS